MAQLTGIFDGLSGRVGNIVYVRRGGKTFVKRLPSKRKTPYTELELSKHSIFGLVCKIAGRICQVEELKHFWKPVRSKNQSSSNRIFKANYNQFDIEKFEGFIYLSPELGFYLNEPLLKICRSGLQIECDPITNSDFDYNNKAKYFIAAGIILLKSPKQEDYPEYDIISFKSEKILINPDSLIDIKIELKGAELNKWKGYSIKKAFATLITIDDLGNPLRNSQILVSNP
jgi:hypothetical protein